MTRQATYVQSLCGALHNAMEQDASVVVFGEDILDPYGGAFKVTRGLSTRFPTRTFTTPICEATIVGLAIGLALRGHRPVAEIMFGDFVTLAIDQLINHAAKMRAMYNGQVDLPLVIRTPMGGGRGYGPTHSQSLERLLFGVPHAKVVAPSHFHEAGSMLEAAIVDTEPVLFVENKLLYPQPLELSSDVDGLERTEVPGATGYPGVVLRNYERSQVADVTVFAYGGMSRLLGPLLRRFAQEEVRILAYLPGCISPLELAPILDCAAQSGRVIVIDDGYPGFGWGAEVAACIYAALYRQLRTPIERVGALPTVIPAAKSLEEEILVSERRIESAILESLRW